jgi:hypothetical protein
MIPDGIHLNTRRDQYDLIERVNFSTLKHIKKSPKHYRHALTNPSPDTDAKKLGRAVHIGCFEPEKFAFRVVRWDGGTRRGKEWDAFRRANADREILTENEYEECAAIQQAVRSDKRAAPYVSGGRGEVTLAWTDEVKDRGANNYSIPCKGRIDFDVPSAIVDLKTTRDITQEAFGKQVWGLDYHAQAAWYVDGYYRATGIRKPFVMVAVEHTAPYDVVVYHVPERHLEMGREQYRDWLDRLAICRETATWPGYANDCELELELPRWAEPDDDIGGLGLVVGGT